MSTNTTSCSLLDCGTDPPFFSLNGTECDAKIVSCYDGDTVHAVMEVFGKLFKFHCRLNGIDTPELKTRNMKEKAHAVTARDALSNMILHKIVRLKCKKFDKYGRLLIDIYLPDTRDDEEGVEKKVNENENEKEKLLFVNEWMVQNGFAHYYAGKTKQKWVFDNTVA